MKFPMPVPVGDGLKVDLHRGGEQHCVHVTRGNLCSPWFKVKCREDGHMDLYEADRVTEPELRGAPQLSDLSDAAAEAGWKLGKKPAPAAKAAPKSKAPAK